LKRGHQSSQITVLKQAFQGENYERGAAFLEKLRPIASRHHTSFGNLAIAWLIAQPFNLQA